MTIPLDNLYHYIDDQFNGNALIYRFYPHGAKKQCNLWPLEDIQAYDTIIKPVCICHDQEPLQFDLYSYSNQIDYLNSTVPLELHDHLKKHNLDFDTWANIYQKKILLHSELKSTELDKYESSGLFAGAYYWSHAFIARDWYRYAKVDPKLCKQPNIDWLFNVYCRAWTGSRSYRLKFLEKLKQSPALFESRVRFSHYDNGEHYDQYTSATFDFFENTADSNSSAGYDPEDIKSSLFDVVLETVVDRIMLTEKVLRPIACGQPFILMAGAGSLKLLQSYGFRTFSQYIDESYDDIEDTDLRMQAVVDTMARARNMDIKKFQDQLLAIAEYNKNHFFSDEFFEQISSELQQNLKIASYCAYKKKAFPLVTVNHWSLPVSLHDPVTIQQAIVFCKNTIPVNPLRWKHG